MKIPVLPFTFALALSASVTYAQPTAQQDGPCMKIMEACKNAGFGRANPGGTRTSLSKDCMQPLLNGQPVTGITLNPADIAACKAKKSELKAGK